MIWVPENWALGWQNPKIDPNPCLPILLDWFKLKNLNCFFNLWLSDLVVSRKPKREMNVGLVKIWLHLILKQLLTLRIGILSFNESNYTLWSWSLSRIDYFENNWQNLSVSNHLELGILENSQFFCSLFVKITSKKIHSFPK